MTPLKSRLPFFATLRHFSSFPSSGLFPAKPSSTSSPCLPSKARPSSSPCATAASAVSSSPASPSRSVSNPHAVTPPISASSPFSSATPAAQATRKPPNSVYPYLRIWEIPSSRTSRRSPNSSTLLTAPRLGRSKWIEPSTQLLASRFLLKNGVVAGEIGVRRLDPESAQHADNLPAMEGGVVDGMQD